MVAFAHLMASPALIAWNVALITAIKASLIIGCVDVNLPLGLVQAILSAVRIIAIMELANVLPAQTPQPIVQAKLFLMGVEMFAKPQAPQFAIQGLQPILIIQPTLSTALLGYGQNQQATSGIMAHPLNIKFSTPLEI